MHMKMDVLGMKAHVVLPQKMDKINVYNMHMKMDVLGISILVRLLLIMDTFYVYVIYI